MEVTIKDISKWFLSKESMTHKKLQKLCYYSQAWTLALLDRKLFSGDFEAWVHGPVNVELYQEYNGYGWQYIPKIENFKLDVEENVLEILESVFYTYGDYTANQLEWKTHQEKPWIEARKGLDEWENSNNVISEELIKEYYRSIYKGD